MTIEIKDLDLCVAKFFLKNIKKVSFLEATVLEILVDLVDREIKEKKDILENLYIYETDNLSNEAVKIIKYLINKENL